MLHYIFQHDKNSDDYTMIMSLSKDKYHVIQGDTTGKKLRFDYDDGDVIITKLIRLVHNEVLVMQNNDGIKEIIIFGENWYVTDKPLRCPLDNHITVNFLK